MKEKESLGLTECESTLVIKYNRPALDLSDGLTVGNGRLSANICGTERGIERIMLCGGRLYTAVCAEHGRERALFDGKGQVLQHGVRSVGEREVFDFKLHAAHLPSG